MVPATCGRTAIRRLCLSLPILMMLANWVKPSAKASGLWARSNIASARVAALPSASVIAPAPFKVSNACVNAFDSKNLIFTTKSVFPWLSRNVSLKPSIGPRTPLKNSLGGIAAKPFPAGLPIIFSTFCSKKSALSIFAS